MKEVTVTAFGREWNHRQFHGLVEKLVAVDVHVQFMLVGPRERGAYLVGKYAAWEGTAPSLWLALVAAVEKMEGESHV